jgi:excinuclease ABC subunit A
MPAKNRAELSDQPANVIEIIGANTHNLKDVHVVIPHGRWTVITGVSGSGKSSLVFDTLYAEGQRQYLCSLAAHTRNLMETLPRPPLASIRGLQPTLCVDQSFGSGNVRSTVSTLADLDSYLRLFMARIGTPYCYKCGTQIQQQASEEIIHDILSLPIGTKLTILAPIVRGKLGSHGEVFAKLTKTGLVKARVDGELMELEEVPVLDAHRVHTIEAICDRVILKEDSAARVEAAVHVALRLTDGLVVASSGEEKLYSTKYACHECGLSFAEIEPRIFSFNSPYGACPDCDGLGFVARKTKSDDERQLCRTCDGTRLRPEPRSIRVQDLSIDRLQALSIHELLAWFGELRLDGTAKLIAEPIVTELLKRLHFLDRMGLGYLSLSRSVDSLSGGERQRVRLGSSLGSGLTNVCYILDEPSIGLHPSDRKNLIDILCELRDQGNTLVVVEHDPQIMLAADHLIDIGPGAGPEGGKILASGSPRSVAEDPQSVTGPFLKRELDYQASGHRRAIVNDHLDQQSHPCIEIRRASLHNLKKIIVKAPLHKMIGIVGVSGSGKSSLVLDTLVPAVQEYLRRKTSELDKTVDGPFESISGLESIEKLVVVDQQPLGRNARSTPATYLEIWDLIRDVFAQTREAKQRGFSAARFGFNSGPGRCEACQGLGQENVALGFMDEVTRPCLRCQGARFNKPSLAVRYKSKSIGDVLGMSCREALGFFENFSKLAHVLQLLCSIGLGYLKLGQSSQTLSGGEAQRLKIAFELARPSAPHTLYVLDEPTTGLHPLDVGRLVAALQALVQSGHSVMVIEHDLDLIRHCHWRIELGPRGGPMGGQLLYSGPNR